MIAAVADTHTIVWYLFADSRLSVRGRELFDQAAQAGRQVAVSSVTLAELVYLIEKGRLREEVLSRLLDAFDTEELLVEAPLDRRVVKAMQSVLRSEVPDLPDRVIAATAVHLGVPLVSRDRKIRVSQVETIW